MSENEKMIYLNTPITNKENDIIGLSVCADKLSDAIDAGAQMIAITSPFGAGKTSVIDLLQEKLEKNKNEHILKIPMWSQLHQLDNHTNELHKNFLYQISSLINHRRGTYISRRLSNNYGLLILDANKQRSWLFFTIALLFGCVSWCVNHFPENIENLLPILEDKTEYLTIALAIMAIYICIVALTRSEIIFSSRKSEKERTIEEDEIIDLYRSEILKYSTRLGKWVRGKTRNCKHWPLREHKYIIVVEDLDRTNDGKSVIKFLTELRKYYLPTNCSKSKTGQFKNKVVFIVNIKSESVLLSEIKSRGISINEVTQYTKGHELIVDKSDGNNLEKENVVTCGNIFDEHSSEHLFAKIFDYVLSLQTINIVDYETILEGLLNAKKDTLSQFDLKTSGKLIEIPGMLWLIRGKTLDIREIKNRLNKAFLIYETLHNRFPTEKKQISFEKCAMVAYLTTAFEYEFHLTDDVAFQKLIELYIKQELSEESCKSILNAKNDEYVKAVLELIESKLIDDSYRMYFYNYPKDSKIYSYSETIVQKAILYGEESEELDSAINNVIDSNSSVIVDSFEKMKQLKLRLPSVVYSHENLYIQALNYAENEVILWLDNFDKSTSAIDKNISEILRILRYDSLRNKYSNAHAKRFCDSWEKVFLEDGLLKLRACLCEQFSNEIIWYKPLFFGVHNIIRISEMEFLTLADCINLINVNNDNFGFNEVEYVVNRFCEVDNVSDTDVDKVKSFLFSVKLKIDLTEITKLYLTFMKKINVIIPKFEETIVELLSLEADNDEEDGEYFISSDEQEAIFVEYQELINQVDCQKLSMQTLSNVSEIKKFDGYERYTDDVASILYVNNFYVDYILISLLKNNQIDLNDVNIYSTIKESAYWFYSESKVFRKLRIYIIEKAKDIISDFGFMFSEDVAVVSEYEFVFLENRKDIDEENILKLIPAQLVTAAEAKFISKYFCRKNQNNNIAFEFLKYVANMTPDVSSLCFEYLDFVRSIQYFRFSADKKNIIKKIFVKILNLDSCEGKLNFMKLTNILDSNFEMSISKDLIDDEGLQRNYVDIINNGARNVTKVTLKNLYSFRLVYGLRDTVTERYYKDKKYTYYVVSKIVFHKRFTLDIGDRLEELWPIYIDVLGKKNFASIHQYMVSNQSFLSMIIKRKAYGEFTEEMMMYLTPLYQDSDSLKQALEYGAKFAIKYFSVIEGFVDYDAANTFVDIVEQNNQILASDDVYNNTYEKLWNAPLKSRYTKLRKKNGYMK